MQRDRNINEEKPRSKVNRKVDKRILIEKVWLNKIGKMYKMKISLIRLLKSVIDPIILHNLFISVILFSILIYFQS